MANELELLQQELAYLKLLQDQCNILPHLYRKKYSWQSAYINSISKVNLLTAANQVGKGLCYASLVPTPGGYRTIESLQVGDYVFGRDGKLTKIIAIPFDDIDECYEITFDDGSKVEVSGNHEWICKTSKQRFRKHIHQAARHGLILSLING
jgi:hypothetical protein